MNSKIATITKNQKKLLNDQITKTVNKDKPEDRINETENLLNGYNGLVKFAEYTKMPMPSAQDIIPACSLSNYRPERFKLGTYLQMNGDEYSVTTTDKYRDLTPAQEERLLAKTEEYANNLRMLQSRIGTVLNDLIQKNKAFEETEKELQRELGGAEILERKLHTKPKG